MLYMQEPTDRDQPDSNPVPCRHRVSDAQHAACRAFRHGDTSPTELLLVQGTF